ncbi:hypothetical protein RvY_16229 [Ramazzottius varieornatus]|uniref:Uncharacterized protein n=1 Tax=Ramazzottius varieornatus TaxID=947166 RepID=A0A1D1W486_RAMVA|nr:hypothetical protein RvY_16229 [Ramazzottius varieornatus]
MSFQKVTVLLLVMVASACAQSTTPSQGFLDCCYFGTCPADYYCYPKTSTSFPPPGQASAYAGSSGSNPSGALNLGNAAVAGYNLTVGFHANGVSQNNASGPSAAVNSNVQVSSTNTNTSNPVVSNTAGANSFGNAALGAVNNLDQATATGNMTSSMANGQSQFYGNGTSVSGNSYANANANEQRSMKMLRSSQKNKKIITVVQRGRGPPQAPRKLQKKANAGTKKSGVAPRRGIHHHN